MSLQAALAKVRNDLHKAEAAHPDSPELAALHKSLRQALYTGRKTPALALTDDDVRALDTDAGGEPKGGEQIEG